MKNPTTYPLGGRREETSIPSQGTDVNEVYVRSTPRPMSAGNLSRVLYCHVIFIGKRLCPLHALYPKFLQVNHTFKYTCLFLKIWYMFSIKKCGLQFHKEDALIWNHVHLEKVDTSNNYLQKWLCDLKFCAKLMCIVSQKERGKK